MNQAMLRKNLPLLFLAILLLMSYVGYIPVWFGDLCSHFRLQFSVLFVLAMLMATVARKPSLVLIALLGIGLNLQDLIATFQPPKKMPFQYVQSPRLKVMQMNLLISNTAYDKAAAVMQQWKPDLISLQEINPKLLPRLQSVLKSYPYFLILPKRGHTSSIGFFSRFPLLTKEARSFAQNGAAGIETHFNWQGKHVTVVTIHPLPPVTPFWYDQRNAQLEGLARARLTLDPNLLVMGDFNNTPFSPSFKAFLEKADLRDSRSGFGYQGSWPSFLPFLQIPIDHVLTNPDWVVLNRQVGPFMGSDHFPILVELALR